MARISAEERRVDFVRAAATVIATQGVASATTRRIAEAANAPLATLHYCFRNKEELMAEVYNYLSRDYAQALPPVPTTARGIRGIIEAHAERVWARMLANPHEQVTTFELLLRRFRVDGEGEAQALEVNRTMYEGWSRSTHDLFRDAAIDAGEAVPINLKEITRLFIAGVDGISMQHLADPDEERAAGLVRLLVRGLIASLDYEA
ncbi:TetR/AcrR family transcriptional regulator [Micrococcales bacterium 31B]|nr:TetR/AcrR family transcriptional regulator [Micrococcales bacterium 31B]